MNSDISSWRPKGTSSLIYEIDLDRQKLPDSTCFLLRCGDETYVVEEGAWGLFGRNADVCHVIVYASDQTQISRIAAILWCLDGEMWVRNISTHHELIIEGSIHPLVLPARQPHERGMVCCIPAGGCIRSPGSVQWSLFVDPVTPSRAATPHIESPKDSPTEGPPAPPEELVDIAIALCAPLFSGEPAATYRQVGDILGCHPRVARDRVELLVSLYRQEVQEALLHDHHAAAYDPVARLLVARGYVTRTDVVSLLGDIPPSTWSSLRTIRGSHDW